VAIAIAQCLRAASSSAGLAGALVALAALSQGILCLPSSTSYRKLLLLLLLIPCIAKIPQNTSVSSWGPPISQTIAKPDLHPIEKLAAHGQSQFSFLLTSQSSTLRQAVVEYIRRYKRNPPPNFDKWFELAEREEYVLFDEFDTMMESLEPYWGISPSDLRNRVDGAFEDPRLIRFNISNATVSFDHEGWAPWIADQVQSWLPPEWRPLLPNMTFAINILDEPRVVAPFNALSRALHDTGINKPFGNKTDRFEDRTRTLAGVDFLKVDRMKAWEAMAPACSIESPARTENSLEAEYQTVQFISNATDSLDVCMHTSLRKTHGFLSSPDSLEITHSLVPIFSQGKPSIFNDVLIPSPYYAGKMEQREYVPEDDPDWTQKSDILYWSGATTGGYATMENWKSLHRQRLVLSLKSQPSNLVPLLNETSPGQWDPHMVPVSELESLFNLKMIGTAQCEPEACEAQRHAFNIMPFGGEEENPNKDPLNLAYQARYALDIDGNGFSGRYYRLLKSRSAVIKQTVFKEWHDGHLVPWVHYIPLSMEAAELPEIMRFLTQDQRGREIGRRIARKSRSWANITLRKIDLQLAFLRLLLEYGRLISDDRDSLNYAP
jgi:Glycosyl transferase family 90